MCDLSLPCPQTGLASHLAGVPSHHNLFIFTCTEAAFSNTNVWLNDRGGKLLQNPLAYWKLGQREGNATLPPVTVIIS